jgi:ankyrin repeat protein
VQFDGETIESAPPLWCAAAAGHLDVVKCLVEHKAKVNSTTKTKSTPLRAACYDGHLEIVKYLIQNQADPEIANRHGHTCLMIACYKGHYDIARFLIDCKADVNRKSVKGNTALHDCAESGSLDIMQLLLDNNAKMDIDSYGVTPLIAAALTGHSLIVELIISKPDCRPEERVDALDLLAATFVDKKRDMMSALNYWRRSLQDRKSFGLQVKRRSIPVAAYSDAVEVTTEQELENLFADPDDMRMQALLVRERILGPAHPDTSYYIRYRGAVYADTGDYEKCIKLWMYALNMQQAVLDTLNPMIQSSLLSFAELFSFMMTKSLAKVRFSDLFAVFERALTQLHLSQQSVSSGSDLDGTFFQRNLVVVLHFIGLLCRLQPYLDDEEVFQFRKAAYGLVRSRPRARNGMTPLHLACLRDSSCPSLRFPLCEFPMPEMVRLLLEVGAGVNDVDREGNTALHIVAASPQPVSYELVNLLLDNGAHFDVCNSKGQTASDLMKPFYQSSSSFHVPIVSLQCLAAQVLTRNKIPVSDQLPLQLVEFVQLH